MTRFRCVLASLVLYMSLVPPMVCSSVGFWVAEAEADHVKLWRLLKLNQVAILQKSSSVGLSMRPKIYQFDLPSVRRSEQKTA